MEEVVQTYRPAEDIAEDVAALIRSYPPLVQSRPWLHYSVEDGVVTLKGHVNSAITQRVLLDNLPRIPGVVQVDAAELHNDEDVRLAVAALLPLGVAMHVNYGFVLLTGTLPPRRKAEPLIARVEKVPGVRQVESRLS